MGDVTNQKFHRMSPNGISKMINLLFLWCRRCRARCALLLLPLWQLCVSTRWVTVRQLPPSENQRAQASVSDASLIRVEDFISASPQRSLCLSVRSALAVPTLHGILHLKLARMPLQSFLLYSISLSARFGIQCRPPKKWDISIFKWAKENQLWFSFLSINQTADVWSSCCWCRSSFLSFHRGGNSRL